VKLLLALAIGALGGVVGGLIAAKVIESKARAAVEGTVPMKLANALGFKL
jgi:hypothetical protein